MNKKQFRYSKETIDEIIAIYGTSSHVYKYAKEGNTWAERMVAENAEYRCNINLGFEKIFETVNTKTPQDALCYLREQAELGKREKALSKQMHKEVVAFRESQGGEKERELKPTADKDRDL